MGGFAREEYRWILEPLVDAGLAPERIRTLVFHLGFTAIVDGQPGTHARLTDLVRDEPAEVRAAWTAMIGRMIALEEPVPGPSRRRPVPHE